MYRFGDGRKIQAIQSVKIPAKIGSRSCEIMTDIIDGDIPLLLSKSSMKKGQMKINFQDDTITVLDEKIPLITTSSGHYAVPITQATRIINNFERNQNFNYFFRLTLFERLTPLLALVMYLAWLLGWMSWVAC